MSNYAIDQLHNYSLLIKSECLVHQPVSRDSEGTRTPNPQNRNLIFYPIELRSRGGKGRKKGVTLQSFNQLNPHD